MSVPDRPTREQIDAVPHKAAALLLAAARPDPTLRTAAMQVQDALIALDAEVRALRAELERWTSGHRRRSWPEVPGVPNGIAMAARLARAACDDEELNALHRDAAVLLRDQTDVARIVVAERDRLRAALAARTPQPAAALDAAHFARQAAFSAETFGPGPRTAGVLDHIRKELAEIEAAPSDLGEWVDVMILAADGAWRAGHGPQEIVDAVIAKQRRNESRTWPDWRTAAPGKAIEHDRSTDAASLPAVPDGEDVPARLDAAAEVLNHLVPLSCAGGDLRRIGVALRLMPVEVRAAVAAALARPTGGEQ